MGKCPKLDSFESNGGSFFLEFFGYFWGVYHETHKGQCQKVTKENRAKLEILAERLKYFIEYFI